MRATGAHQGLGPVLDVCRDPRWGRLEETFGEDPYLVARMGVAFVRGLQGDGPRVRRHRHGEAPRRLRRIGGRDELGACADPAERELHDVYLHPFEAAVRDAGVRSVMNAYNEIDGVPCAADHELLTTLLRDEWGFDGCVVSDYFSVRQLADYHRFALDAADAAVQTLEAGLDVELPSTDCYGDAAPRRGRAAASSARRRSTPRSAACCDRSSSSGSSSSPYVQRTAAAATSDTSEQRGLARTIARKSLVLLRNDGTLPLAASVGSVAVIGPSADDARNLFGDYAYPAHVESLRVLLDSGGDPFARRDRRRGRGAGVRRRVRRRCSTPSARGWGRGCGTRGAATSSGSARDGFAEAVALAREADVAVAGRGRQVRPDRRLHERRDPRPCVARPAGRAAGSRPSRRSRRAPRSCSCSSPAGPTARAALHEGCAAVLLAWLPGQEGADAIADALVGEFSPGGKLPVSYPRSSGQLPVFYGHKISGGRSHWKVDYADEPTAPLYPFGHGLSYTTFELARRRRPPRRGLRGARRSPSTSPSRTPAIATATRSSSSTSATRPRA